MLWFLLACGENGSAAGKPLCTSPNASSAWGGETVYVDQTDAWGLTGYTGGRLVAADIDQDRYPDLVAVELFSNARDDTANGVFYHRVFRNVEVDGRRTFMESTLESGLIRNQDGGDGTSHNLYVFADVDNDGDNDAFAGRYYDAGTTDATGDRSDIYLNNGDGTFTLAPASDVHTEDGYATSGAAFTDYNADGKADLWVVGFYEEYGGSYDSAQAQLYQGNGDGSFTAVTEAAELEMRGILTTDNWQEPDRRKPAYGATACDVNGDTLPDLISSNYARSWNFLWRNEGGWFTEIGEESGMNADDNLDYSDNVFYACYCQVYGGCSITPTTDCWSTTYASYWSAGFDDQPGRLNGNTFTTVCSDLDNDGDNDLMHAEIAHKWAGNSSDRTQILLNDGTGVFTRIDNDESGIARPRPEDTDWNEGDITAAFFDFDNDGWKDIVVGSSDYEGTHVWLWRQVEAGRFEEVSDATGLNHPWPAGMAIADFDRDGDLDFVTGSSTARTGTPWTSRELHLYENQSPAGNYLQLAGLPVGTRVEVVAGGLTQTQEVSGGYGHFGIQHDTVLHFGLDDVCNADSVTATKPGGESKTWTDVAGNQLQTLEW